LRATLALLVAGAVAVPSVAWADEPAEPFPPDAVAVVGETVIDRATFDVWFDAAAKGMREVVDPPAFRRCIARRREALPYRHLDGDRARLRRSCARDHRQLVSEVMQFLIEAEWLQGEAELQDIRVSDERVRRELKRQKELVFRNERAYRRFLRTSGMTREMVLFRVRLNVLQRRLTNHVTRDITPTRDPRVRARRQQRALERFIVDFRARWRAETSCADGYVVRECGVG
jgi:SurA N-terminal domain